MSEAKIRHDFVSVCKAKLGAPYVWGSNGPDTFDCSGLVIYGLRKLKLITANEDYSARALKRMAGEAISNAKPGDFAFYGRDGNVSHIAISVDGVHFISASGGNSGTTTIDEAKRVHACVKFHSKPDHRPDFLGLWPNIFMMKEPNV